MGVRAGTRPVVSAVRVPGWLPRDEVDPLTSKDVPNLEAPPLLTYTEVAQQFPELAEYMAREWWGPGHVYQANEDHSVTRVLPILRGD